MHTINPRISPIPIDTIVYLINLHAFHHVTHTHLAAHSYIYTLECLIMELLIVVCIALYVGVYKRVIQIINVHSYGLQEVVRYFFRLL